MNDRELADAVLISKIKERQEWIDEILYVFGYVKRVHVERKFRVSSEQAIVDLAKFFENNKKIVQYNNAKQQYELTYDPRLR